MVGSMQLLIFLFASSICVYIGGASIELAHKPLPPIYYKPINTTVVVRVTLDPPIVELPDKWQLAVRLRDRQVACVGGLILAEALRNETTSAQEELPTLFTFQIEASPRQIAWTVVESLLNLGWHGNFSEGSQKWVRAGDYLMKQLHYLSDYETSFLEMHHPIVTLRQVETTEMA